MRSPALFLAVAVLVAGCGTTMRTVDLNPHGKIEFVEHRTIMSTTPVAVVYDEQNRIVGVAAGSGTSPAAAALGVMQAGAMLGAAAIIANGLRALQSIETVTTGNVTTSGTVTTSGSITGTIDPVQLTAPASMPDIRLVAP